MPGVRDLLLRFRPSGTPGRAGPAGMPVHESARAAAELEPLFAALAATEEECAAILEEGRLRAARDKRNLTDRAVACRAGLHERAAAERAAAASAAHAAGSAAGAALDGEVDAAIAALKGRAEALVPSYVAQVTTAVETLCIEPGGSAP